jgi:hypothetical protein
MKKLLFAAAMVAMFTSIAVTSLSATTTGNYHPQIVDQPTPTDVTFMHLVFPEEHLVPLQQMLFTMSTPDNSLVWPIIPANLDLLAVAGGSDPRPPVCWPGKAKPVCTLFYCQC